MTDRPLAIITTRLPPATCGIGTYSALLRKHWPNDARRVDFLVMEAAAATDTGADSVSAFNGNGAELAEALCRLGDADVLLHYAGRAYHRLGFPLWMPSALAKWRKRFPGGRLMIFFHEVPGKLPITSKHFWFGRLNAYVIRRLAASADVVITNTESQRATLWQITHRDDVELLPVPSNIETTREANTPRARTEFIIFGLPFGRLQTLQSFEAHIRRWVDGQRLTRLHLVGPVDDGFAQDADDLINTWPHASLVVRHGRLASAEVSSLLQQAGFALTNVTHDTWSKSGAFMAAASNRCAVVMRDNRAASAPLCHTISADEVDTVSEQEIDQRSVALARWYYENADWPVIAARVAALWPENRAAS